MEGEAKQSNVFTYKTSFRPSRQQQ